MTYNVFFTSIKIIEGIFWQLKSKIIDIFVELLYNNVYLILQ